MPRPGGAAEETTVCNKTPVGQWLAWTLTALVIGAAPACGGEASSSEQPNPVNCPADCSGHGTCGFVATPECLELGTCNNIPQCQCDLGYTGVACEACAYGHFLDQGLCVAEPVPNNAPNRPSDPQPPNGASLVALDATLGWTGSDQGTQLKVGGAAEFNAPNAGFASLFLGHFDFANVGSSAVFWTSTSNSDGSNAWYRKIDATDSGIDRSLAHKLDAYSVRCIRD